MNKKYSFSLPVIFSFLILINNTTYSNNSSNEKTTRKDLEQNIKLEQSNLKKLEEQNDLNSSKVQLEIQQLLEQGMQVIKPWEHSWQLGVNYFHRYNHGDSRPDYEHFFQRDKDSFIRDSHPYGENYKYLEKNKLDNSSNTNLRYYIGTNYGFINSIPVKEPFVELNLYPSIRPKKMFSVARPEKPSITEITPTEPKKIIFDPILPEPPEIGIRGAISAGFGISLGGLHIRDYSYIISKKDNTPEFLYGTGATPITEAIFAQQEMIGRDEKGQLNLKYTQDNNNIVQNVSAKNIDFYGIYGKEHTKTFSTGEEINRTKNIKDIYRTIDVNSGHTIEMKNIEMNISSDVAFNEVNVAPIIITNIYNTDNNKVIENGDTTLVIDSDSTINMKGTDGVPLAVIANSSKEFNAGMLNKGTININGKNTNIFTRYADEKIFVNGYFFQNDGKINVSGDKNGGFIFKNQKFSFINNGEFITSANQSSALRVETSTGEVILNKPITVNGTQSNGITIMEYKRVKTPSLYATDEDAAQGAFTSEDPDIRKTGLVRIGGDNGKYRDSLFKFDLAGKINAGIAIFNLDKFTLDNFYITDSGKGNRSVMLQYGDTGTVIGNKYGGHIDIVSGTDNVGISNVGVLNPYPELDTETINMRIKDNVTIDVKNAPRAIAFASIKDNAETAANINVSSPGTIGIFSERGKVVNHGKMNFNGYTYRGSDGVRGASGLFVNGRAENYRGYLLSDGDVKITVDGVQSIGVVANTNGYMQISNAEITAKNGAYNAVSAGKIEFNDNNTINTEGNSLAFYPIGSGKILFNKPTVLNLTGNSATNERGTGFYFKNPTHKTLIDLAHGINQQFYDGTLKNLTINLNGGRAFSVENVDIKLSDTAPENINHAGGPKINIDHGITFLIDHGKLNVDMNVNLDNENDPYNLLELISTHTENNADVTGTKKDQLFIHIINKDIIDREVFAANNKNITLTGDDSVALYTKNASIKNNGNIEIGKSSAAMEGFNDSNTEISNLNIINTPQGNIKLGEESIGIIYHGENKNNRNTTAAIIENQGKIESAKNTTTGIYTILDSDNVNIGKLENSGDIELSGDNSIGIFTKNNHGNFNIVNSKNISIGNGTNGKSSAGILTENENSHVINSGNIKVGKNGFGVYGYKITSTPSSNITVGKKSIGYYSGNGDVTLQGNMNLSANSAIGAFTQGTNQNINANLSNINFGNESIAIINHGQHNNIVSNTPNVTLNENNIYILSVDRKAHLTSNTDMTSTSNGNYGIYSAGTVENNGTLDFSRGVGNIGILTIFNGSATNTNNGKIIVGETLRGQSLYSIGMAGGAYDYTTHTTKYEGTVINEGTIEVTGKHGIGMYASGHNSKAINMGNINITGQDGIGILVENGAIGENHGNITATADAKDAIGALAMDGAIFKNYGNITITAPGGIGVVTVRDGKAEGDFTKITAQTPVSNENNVSIDKILPNVSIIDNHNGKDPEITFNDVKTPLVGVDTNIDVPKPEEINIYAPDTNTIDYTLPESNFKQYPSNAEITKLGMYIDTSGVNYTNPIKGIKNLPSLENIEFIIGTEATRYTNSKAIKVKDNIIAPYNSVLNESSEIKKLNIYAGSLTWMGTAKLNEDGITIKNLYLAKIPYTDFANKSDNLYNFADGLEKRYGVEDIYSREKHLFNKLNDIGENEQILLNQAFKEMMGYEYSNTYRRIWDNKLTFDREFDTLMKWDTKTKDTTKVKFFREDNKFRTTRDGITSYNRTSNGVFVLNNNETVTLGDSEGWFFGASIDTYKFKDLGRSKEKSFNGEVGYYKEKPWGYNRELNYLVKGGIQGSYRKMDRRYLVVDEIFNAKSRYHSLGAFVDTKLSSEIRLSEGFKLKPSVGVDFSATKFTNINEKSGQVRLTAKGKTELAATPKAEIILAHSTDRTKDSRIKTELGYKIYKKYATNEKIKAKVNYTDADYYSLGKDKYRTNSEVSLGVALEKPGYGVGAKVIRNLNHNYTSYQLDFRVKF